MAEKKYYIPAKRISRNGGHGDNYSQTAIMSDGAYGSGDFPRLWEDPEACERFCDMNGKVMVELKVKEDS